MIRRLGAMLGAVALPRLVQAAEAPVCSAQFIELEDGTTAMVMDGMPVSLLLIGMVGVIISSFIAVEVFGGKGATPGRPARWRNLIKNRRIYTLLRARWIQPAVQSVAIIALIFLVYAGLEGSRLRNITPVAVWTIWWSGLVFMIALFGPVFCFACPWDGLANLLSRLRFSAKVEPLSLGWTVPSWLRNVYPAIALFVLLSWSELGLKTTSDPRQTAYLAIGITSMAVFCAIAFGNKAFCRYACPVGRISGLYANISPIELRARNPRACESCETEECLNGNERGYPCPVGISLKTVTDSTHCTFCTECIKSCDRYNVALRIRPFAPTLHAVKDQRMDVAWLAITLLALTLFHGLTMTTLWESPFPGQGSLMRWMTLSWGTGEIFNFTVGMVAGMAIPIGLYAGSCWVAAKLTNVAQRGYAVLFTEFSFAVLPVALAYHIAHNSMHVLMEGNSIIPLLSDPLGQGADYFGTAAMKMEPLVSDSTLWWMQLAVVMLGHVLGVVVAHRISHRLFATRKQALIALLPMTLVMIAISVAGLTLMSMDMSMRVGRT